MYSWLNFYSCNCPLYEVLTPEPSEYTFGIADAIHYFVSSPFIFPISIFTPSFVLKFKIYFTSYVEETEREKLG